MAALSGTGAATSGSGGGSNVLVGADPNLVRDTLTIQSVLKTLKSLLDEDQDCKTFLGSGLDKGVFDYMYDAMTRLTGPAVLQGGVNAATGYIGSGYAITISANGAFFNAGAGIGYAGRHSGDMASLAAGSLSGQIFTLLHEAGHFFGTGNNGFLFDGNDDNNHTQSKKNNDLLWDKCGKTLKAAVNAGIQ